MSSTDGLVFAGDWLPSGPLVPPEALAGRALICNLECTVGDAREASRKAYVSTTGPEVFEHIRTSPVAAVSVANNHVYDCGSAAFDEMLSRLRDIPGLQVYGTQERPFAEFELGGARVAVVGCLEPCRSRGPRILREESVAELVSELLRTHDHVFVTPHWGKEGEYAHHPSPRQIERAREWIERGARGVLGHHTHTIHGAERRADARIYYSLGNLLFEFEEGRAYPLTSYGLAVTWNPSPDEAGGAWGEVFLHAASGRLREVEGAQRERLLAFLDELSAALEAEWSEADWAKRVGPVYVPKSNRSWKRRFRRHPIRTAALWSVWRLLPTTRALVRGSRSPDQATLDRIREVEAGLQAAADR